MAPAPVARRKEWDSSFFGREIHELPVTSALDAAAVTAAVRVSDDNGVWSLEAHVPGQLVAVVPFLEAAGFRLVDSKMTFVTEMERDEIRPARVPFGRVRRGEATDLPHVTAMTTRLLVDNDHVYSRFKNPSLFHRSESIAYYDAWNRRIIEECPDLFAVWEVAGAVAGYFTYLRTDPPEHEVPLFKGVLTAVEPAHRGHGVHNALQAWLFPRFGVERWLLDNTTQLSNTAVLTNHIRAAKRFDSATLVFARVRPRPAGW